MSRYLQTQVLFCRRPTESETLMGLAANAERKWAPAVIDLDAVSAANPSWVFDFYDEESPGCPEPNCTEILLRNGQDLSVNMPYSVFVQHLIGNPL